MPIIAYGCHNRHMHSTVKKFYRSAAEAPTSILCEECGESMGRQLSAPSSESKVIVDNGFQARAVEVNPEIIAINKERSNKDYSQED